MKLMKIVLKRRWQSSPLNQFQSCIKWKVREIKYQVQLKLKKKHLKATLPVEPATSALVVDEKENPRDEVPCPVETVEAFLEETVTVEPTTSVPVVGEMERIRHELPIPAKTEEEYLEQTLVV